MVNIITHIRMYIKGPCPFHVNGLLMCSIKTFDQKSPVTAQYQGHCIWCTKSARFVIQHCTVSAQIIDLCHVNMWAYVRRRRRYTYAKISHFWVRAYGDKRVGLTLQRGQFEHPVKRPLLVASMHRRIQRQQFCLEWTVVSKFSFSTSSPVINHRYRPLVCM